MEKKLNVIHWALVADVAVCIVTHRIVLAQADKGSVSELAANVLQITVYGALLFFMATCAGIAVYMWQRASTYGELERGHEKFPKKSFIAALIAFGIFTLYWVAL